tara:strand:- start:20893 stop:21111 length:219 start_codon:yes stop_codon:yes gene_type:complete
MVFKQFFFSFFLKRAYYLIIAFLKGIKPAFIVCRIATEPMQNCNKGATKTATINRQIRNQTYAKCFDVFCYK